MDLRVKRTQNNIREAFITLAEKKKVKKITIRELSELAMINKATFYLHYHDLEDLVSQLEDEVIADGMREIGKADSFFRRVEEFFQRFTIALSENHRLIGILYANERTASLQRKMITALKRKIMEENPHIEFTMEMDIVLTFMLRGVMDVRLYEEFSDRQMVIQALSTTIKVVTNHYRDIVKEDEKLAALKSGR